MIVAGISVPVVAEVKALVVMAGVLGCFALGGTLVRRTVLGRHL